MYQCLKQCIYYNVLLPMITFLVQQPDISKLFLVLWVQKFFFDDLGVGINYKPKIRFQLYFLQIFKIFSYFLKHYFVSPEHFYNMEMSGCCTHLFNYCADIKLAIKDCVIYYICCYLCRTVKKYAKCYKCLLALKGKIVY